MNTTTPLSKLVYDWQFKDGKQQKYALKYMKRSNMYKGANVSFNPVTLQAYSYDWWKMTQKIGPHLVFNDYMYSVSTRKHQNKIHILLGQLGITINHYIEAPKGLQDLQCSIDHYNYLIKSNIECINKPRSQKRMNDKRLIQNQYFKCKITFVKKLMKIKEKDGQ